MKVARLLVAGLLSVFVLGAFSASALAEGTSDEFVGTGTFEGSQTETNVFTTNAGKVECKKATFKGSLTGSSTKVKVTPTYKECTAFGFAAEVKMEGCTYEFVKPVDLQEEALDKEHSLEETKVVCGTGKTIVVNAGGGICKAKVGAQGGLKSVTGTNEGAEEVLVTAAIKSITYTLEGACGTENGTFTNGEYAGKVKVKKLTVN